MADTRRVLVTGRLVDEHGNPAPDVTLRALPTFAFRATLDAAAQEKLATLSWPTTITEPDGLFSIYLDPSALGQTIRYEPWKA